MANKFLSGINVTGTTTLNTVANAGTDTDKFLVLDASGNVDFRTGAELYADLGIGSLPSGFTSTLKHAVKAGVALTKGQAVYVTSADGTNMIVGKASNASEATSSKTLGLIETALSINGIGNVITEGLLAGLDTTGATNAGDPVWLGTDGNLIYGLLNKPYAPAHLVFIGVVTRINANNGEIFVKVQNGFELKEIHDVDLITTTPINGHILGYNGTLWVNKTIAGWLGFTPADDSLVVKLAGTQTITGAKTFSLAISGHEGIAFLNGVMPPITSSYYSGIGGNSNGISIVTRPVSTNYTNNLYFAASNNSFTFPNATGTIALTSDLTAYVPTSRTLTINGVAYDLSADRSWTIEAGGSSASTRTIQKFTSTSSQTTFTITGGYTVGMVDVWVNGIKLDNAVDFTASNGTTVVLTDALTASQIVEVYKYGSQFIVNNGLRQKTLFTATAGQTTFTVAYSVGLVDVYYNGSKLDDSEFTATNGTSIVLGTACAVNDKVEVIAFSYNVNGFTGIGGSGTTNNLPKFTAAGTIGDSAITDDGTTVTLVSRALSGTSAAFSGSATFGSDIFTYANGGIFFSGGGVYTSGIFQQSGGNLILQTGTTPRLTIASNGAATFTSSVTAGGNIYAPNTLIDPTTGNATNNGTVYGLNGASTVNSYGIGVGAIRNSTYDVWFQTGAINGGGYRWYIGTSEKMTMSSTGNLGIATTSPQTPLQILRDTNTNGTNIEENNMAFTVLSAANQSKIAIGASNAGNYGYVQVMQDATSWTSRNLTLQPRGGNVGVGTYTPQSLLQVGAFSGNNVLTIGGGTSGVSSLYLGDGTGAALYVGFIEYNHSGDFMRIGTNGAERVRVNGNSERTQVLIGTDTPIYTNTNRGQLVVNGIASSLIGLQRNGGGAMGYLYADANSFQIAADSGVNILMYPQNAIQAGVDNAYTMGASGARWSAIWAANGTIQTSDARQKKDITDSNLGLDFINKLRPVSYKWIVGGNSVETSESDNENEVVKRTITANEGKRNHYGLIAQEVKEVLGDIDFGGYVYDEETDTMALRYDQFISPMIKAIQELKAEIEILKQK